MTTPKTESPDQGDVLFDIRLNLRSLVLALAGHQEVGPAKDGLDIDAMRLLAQQIERDLQEFQAQSGL